MPFMLPVAASHSRSITGVASEMLRALAGNSNWGPAQSVVLGVIDGLGSIPLRAHAGHARYLMSLASKKSVAHTVFPSTTASALTSLLTGADPGQHGHVGYCVRDPRTGLLHNQLTGWGPHGFDPVTWQRAETIFDRATAVGFQAFAVGPSVFAGSGLSQAILRGATYIAVDSLSERYLRAVELAHDHPGSFVYCYMPEVDKAGHKFGIASGEWITALENVDAAMAQSIPSGVGVVITSDHGMVDVPRHRHVLLGEKDDRWHGVAKLGGEPRFLHVYVNDGESADAVAGRWRDRSALTAHVLTRSEAVAAGVFGRVDPPVVDRIGDVVVMARGLWAFYDDTTADDRSQGMIGQHGSLTPEEVSVPLLRAGVFSTS